MTKTLDVERVKATFRKLAVEAVELNRVSDELTQIINVWDDALTKLNLGVAAWVIISQHTSDSSPATWWTRSVGYAKVDKLWCTALKRVEGWADNKVTKEEIWSFGNAPRWLRLEAIGFLPAVLDALVEQTQETTSRIAKAEPIVLELLKGVRSLKEEQNEKA